MRNIKGVLYGIAAALPHMQRQKSGNVINVASVAGDTWLPNDTVYCATKFAVRALSEGLRQEVKPFSPCWWPCICLFLLRPERGCRQLRRSMPCDDGTWETPQCSTSFDA
ncbi:putative short-chain dehydrogenase/oxidoreductase [Paraburkholderia hospita]|uniref:Short-chain dehydrogenase/oxidoreductase n=1 Tax=Paraburkholderia hospita TaxID=169430 RepID=A0ABP2PPB5_9BURK|nr:putative short-chain dehydrogenase/oxidoreductase [Paraburkholderia hospita]